MIKRLFLFMLIFTFSMTVISIDAYAQPKMDSSNFIGKVKEKAQRLGRKAQKIAEKVKKFVQGSVLGKIEEAKNYKNELEGKVSDVKDQAEEKVGDVKDKVEEKAEGANKIKDKAETAKDKVEKKKDDLAEKGAPLLEAKALEAKKSELNSKYDQQALAIGVNYDKWFEIKDKEISAAKEAGDTALLEELTEDREILDRDKAGELEDNEDLRASELAGVDRQLAALAEKTAKDNGSIAEDLFSDVEGKEESPSVANLDKQFFAEEDTTENQLIIKDVREQLATNDMVNLLETSITVDSQLSKQEKKIEELNTGVLTVEYSPSINLSVEMDIQIMRAMLKNIRLKNAKLRREVTKELAKSPDIKSNPGTQDLQSFDIEDYSYARNCKKTGGGFLDKVKGLAEKGVGGVNLNDVKKAKEEISNAKI